MEGLIERESVAYPNNDRKRELLLSLRDRVDRLRKICSLMLMLLVAFTAVIYSNPDAEGFYCQSTYLWRVDSKHHLFGTMHVHPNDFEPPEEMKKAFHFSDAAYFETDLFDTDHILKETRCGGLESGVELSDIIPSDLYQRLESYIENSTIISNSVLGNHWKTMKPYMINLLLVKTAIKPNTYAVENQRNTDEQVKDEERMSTEQQVDLVLKTLGIAPVANEKIVQLVTFLVKEGSAVNFVTNLEIDAYMALIAAAKNKKVGGVETAQDRCDLIDKTPLHLSIYQMHKALSEVENLREISQYRKYANDHINKYRNMNLVRDDFNDDAVISDEEFDELLKDSTLIELAEHKEREMMTRNKVMADRARNLIRSSGDSKLFFAFGAAHFLGDGSVVQYLRDVGHRVERVNQCYFSLLDIAIAVCFIAFFLFLELIFQCYMIYSFHH